MKNDTISFTLLLISVILFCSCKQKIDYDVVKSKIWSHESGFQLGHYDFMVFRFKNDIWALKHDTIFMENKPTAIIMRLSKDKYFLHIRSINTNEEGEYTDMNEPLRSDQ